MPQKIRRICEYPDVNLKLPSYSLYRSLNWLFPHLNGCSFYYLIRDQFEARLGDKDLKVIAGAKCSDFK